MHDANASTVGGKSVSKGSEIADASFKDPNADFEQKHAMLGHSSCLRWAFFPCALICNFCSSSDDSSSQQMSEDGMFYCSLCEVEVGRTYNLVSCCFSFFLCYYYFFLVIFDNLDAMVWSVVFEQHDLNKVV